MAALQKMEMFLLLMLITCQNAYSFMDIDELKSVYYGLDILSEPVVINKDVPVGAVHVTSKYGQQYQCTFPDHSTAERKKEQEEKIAIETGIVDMLKPIGLKDCLFKSKDWWSYEFCYGKYIRQFHMEDGEIKGNIIYLGYYESDFDWTNATAREDRLKSKTTLNRYHSQLYTLGTKCDLTSQMRKAEVRFVCEENSEDYLSRVDESETCVYTVTVMTSRICRHPYLKAPIKRKPVPITCNPLLSEDQYQDYVAEKEEEKMEEERRAAEAKTALQREDELSPADLETELKETLANELSMAAKELLAASAKRDASFPTGDSKAMSKGEFEKIFGTDDTLWQLYQRGLDITKKQNEFKELAAIDKLKANQKGETQEDQKVEQEEAADEDEEVLEEFKSEINAIKASFQTSQNQLSNIKRKLILERQWETEIENAIKEAEQELGVKVDRSLISGLSNTLDKLASKIHNTEAEIKTMDKEIERLKPGAENGGDKDLEDKEGKVETVDQEDDASDGVIEEELDEADEGLPQDLSMKEEKSSTADLDEKVLAPPKVGAKPAGSKDLTQDVSESSEPSPDAPVEEHSKDVLKFTSEREEHENDGEDDIQVTLQKVEDDDIKLPKDVQKLLEESVKNEFQKYRMQSAETRPLRLDTDHSFTREKTVHVIQQEDEDGKTNRFIFVFGFNSFGDENAEQDRQSALEENYGFVYKGKKSKKNIDIRS
ncbi:unnamed protein product [Lymnaea stagnalis]|uniref:MRH domain-containing protein n=1 Tax=Lymnaea stagnalis TaxID=6523 RepID=A0AAV2IE76_LYMST